MYGAALLFHGTSVFAVHEELLPGSYVAVFGGVEASIEARLVGFHLKDTLLVLQPGPRSDLVSLFRKPIEQPTIAEQVLATGTGAMNIDACRVWGDRSEFFSKSGKPRSGLGHANGYGMGEGFGGANANPPHQLGRWPSNLALIHGEGCRLVGHTQVDGHKGYPNGPGGSSSQFSQKGEKTTRTGAWAGHADADGKESVPVWECVQGCAREVLDTLSGPLRARGNTSPTKRHQSDGVTGWGIGPDGITDPGDTGGASRFYPQFADVDDFLAWVERLILPPGSVLFR